MTQDFALKTLTKHFGYSEFRPSQRQIVDSIYEQHDTLALLPTGGGKSLCYQVPGLMLPGITLVISPLLSLMKDQVDQLNSRGIFSAYINSALSKEEREQRYILFLLKKYKFVYVSPEKLTVKRFVALCQKVHISLIAVDEAHCISEWGHEFRPEYRQIHDFVQQLPVRPVVAAFTATATEKVRTDICTQLKLETPKHFVNSFQRDNLFFWIKKCECQQEKEILLLRILRKHQGQSGIIYCITRAETERVAQFLRSLNFHCQAYHAGLPSAERNTLQEQFIKDEIQLITATNAFGMGVDKPNVRFVVHYQVPGSLEAYYQEAGRAGRDGQPSWCYFLGLKEDAEIQKTMIKDTPYEQERFRKVLQLFNDKLCKVKHILEYFAESREKEKCVQCNSCVECSLEMDTLEKRNFSYLLRVRDHLANKYHTEPHFVSPQLTLQYMTLVQPETREEFGALPGIGKGWWETWHPHFEKALRRMNTIKS